MSRTTDQCTTIDANANEETNADTFASYVRASKKCPSCGRPMKLIKSKSGKFFLACAGYPACRKTLPVDIDMIEEYFYRNSKKGSIAYNAATRWKPKRENTVYMCSAAERKGMNTSLMKFNENSLKTAFIAKSLRCSASIPPSESLNPNHQYRNHEKPPFFIRCVSHQEPFRSQLAGLQC